MIPRTLETTIKRAMRTFPVVLVTGPRQSGKTTLLTERFAGTHRFVSLENPDIRARVVEDPIGFLKEHPPRSFWMKSSIPLNSCITSNRRSMRIASRASSCCRVRKTLRSCRVSANRYRDAWRSCPRCLFPWGKAWALATES
jgi:hypothetical protein